MLSANSNDKHKMQDRLYKVQYKIEHWILAEMERSSIYLNW